MEVQAGINHQYRGGFNLGGGYAYFFFNDDPDGFAVGAQGWLFVELGYSF